MSSIVTQPLRKMKRNLAIATGAAFAASFAMNGLFGWSLGTTLLSSVIMTAPALALEIFKGYSASNAAHHASRILSSELVIPADRRYKPFMQTKFRFEHLVGTITNIAFLVIGVLVSALAAAGFYAMTRGSTLASFESSVAAYTMAEQTVADETAAIARLEALPAFQNAAQCPPGKSDFAFPANAAFCTDYASHVSSLDAARKTIRAGRPVNTDAQAVLFARITGLDLSQVLDGLTGLFVLVSEMLSGFGYLVIRLIDQRVTAEGEVVAKPKRKARKPRTAKPAYDDDKVRALFG